MSRIKTSDGLPKGTAEVVIHLVDTALSCDWNVTTNRNGIVAISAPPPHAGVRHMFRPNQRVDSNRIMKSILTHGTPSKVTTLAAAAYGEHDGTLPPGSAEAVVGTLRDASISKGKVDLFEDREPAEPKKVKPVPRHIVSKRPMLAKQRDDRAYESKIAEERNWSDETVDFKCLLCEYTSENRLSIRSHYRKHINDGTAKVLGREASDGSFVIDMSNVPGYAPRQARIDALAAVLAKFLDEGSTPQEVALQALTWVHQQTKGNSEHAESRATEDLTAEQILENIRNMIGGGINPQQQAQIVELELVNTQLTQRIEVGDEEMDALRAEVESIKAERDAANDRHTALRAELATLRELMGNLGGE